MSAIAVCLLLALTHISAGSESIDELLKKYPTWSFEAESVETSIKNTLHELSLKGQNHGVTEEILREKVRRSLAPGATHIVRKIGDPKWESDPEKFPSSFDAREHWKDCASLISYVEDEGPCRTDTGCVPFTYPACDHTSWYNEKGLGKKRMNPCKGQLIFDHDCPTKCTNEKYKKSLDKDRKKLTAHYRLSRNEFSIRNEIMTYGPVMTSVMMYDDFLEKPDGIFQNKKDRRFLILDKFIKIIGWGEEKGIKYWLCMNTWDSWGDKVFKIPRGVDYNLIEYLQTTGAYEDLDL
ncbi:cathepsin B-like cysteine proteinase 3 isoform X2 [Bemisia tabaci]|uniref:cathepsin B-like cysteine proteinase 3 isoform X2 n=1 Tax=Bemisia tabaci TaxID=7038 RepID=UPI003B287836